MAAPNVRLTKVDFKIETFNGEFDLNTGVQVNCRKLVAYTTFEAGSRDQEQFHSVIRIRGVVAPGEGEAAAIEAAWANLNELVSHWSDQTGAWAKAKLLRMQKSA